MSWSTIPPAHQSAIAAALTSKQLDVYKLHLAGCGYRRISLMLDINPSTVRTHLDSAMLKIRKLDEQEAA